MLSTRLKILLMKKNGHVNGIYKALHQRISFSIFRFEPSNKK